MRRPWLFLPALLLGGCIWTLEVNGRIETIDETFTGEVRANREAGHGTISVTSNKGASCSGEYVMVEQRQGRGTLTCIDGRIGPFTFGVVGTRGTGSGRLGGQEFVFSFR